MRRSLAAIVVAAFLAASCGGDDNTSVADTSVADTAAPATEAADDSATDSTEPAESTAPESTAPEPTAPEPSDAVLPVPDAALVVQTTPTSGGGARPLLAWESFDGAATYLVIVYAEGGEPYWSTITDRTETYVGGAAPIPDGVDGPEVAEGYSWAVYAEDADGIPIASSPLRPISP